MQYDTLQNLTQKVIRKLSLYSGTDVQIYAEDRIADMIIDAYNTLLDERFWNDCMFWHTYNLTGENGVVGETVSNDIVNFNDIECIFAENNTRHQLRLAHNTTIPSLIEGDVPQLYTRCANDNKIFEVIPYNSTGRLYVRYRKRTTTFLPATIVPFDSLALIYNVCWSYTVDDGANPAEQQKFRQLFENRMQELRSNDVSGVYDWNDDTINQDIYSWR